MSQLLETTGEKSLVLSGQIGSFLAGREVPKDQVAVMSISLGRRRGDCYDDEENFAFSMASMVSGLNFSVLFDIKDADKVDDPKALEPVISDLAQELDRIHKSLVVFVITTPQSAKHPWSSRLCQGIREYRYRSRRMDDTAVYKIIIGGNWTMKEYLREDPDGHYDGAELSAHDLDGYELYYNSDAPTAGNYRLADFMSRVLGRDLPGSYFPAYSIEEIRKIAWNINRESFNAFGTKEGAIPKYPIDPASGRPVFPFYGLDKSQN